MNTPATEGLPGAVGSRPLPRSWRAVRLSDVCEESIPTRDPRDSPTDSFRYVDITSVSNVSKRIVSPKTVLGKDAPSRARQVIRTGDVLVATTRPNLNAVALVPTELDGEIASTGFCVLRAKSGLDPRYLFGFVQMGETVRNLSELVKGALYPAVTDAQVRAQWLPLPELSEQRRIVDVLAEQMTAVERARAAAEAQLKAAKALPAAYLRMVFESATAQAWPRRTLAEVSEIAGGIQKSPDRVPVRLHRPYLTVRNVQRGCLDLSEVERFEVTLAEIERLRLLSGDILVVEGNGSIDQIGRNAMFVADGQEWIHQNHVIRVRLDGAAARPEFVSCFLNCDLGRAQMVKKAETTSGLYTLSAGKVASLEVPVPSLGEQESILSVLGERMGEVERLIEQAGEQLAAMDSLQAALLRRAFSGEL